MRTHSVVLSMLRLRKLVWSALFCLALLANAGEQLQLGHLNFRYPDAVQLRNRTHLTDDMNRPDGLKKYSFVGAVGGVAFGAVAQGPEGVTVTLNYNADKPDGERLEVQFVEAGGRRLNLTAPIYDWQLAPIARFAATDQHACFTLFGQLKDPEEQKALRPNEKVLNYHPALQDTLLGLRIFQADVLILYADSCELPKSGGQYLLGTGEAKPDVDANHASLAKVHSLLNTRREGRFRSYVVCDYNVPVTFQAKGGRLQLTGNPTWYCWKSAANDPAGWKLLNDRANEKANDKLRTEFNRDRNSMGVAEFNAKYNPAYQHARFEELFDDVARDIGLMQAMPEYSRALSDEIQKQRGVNPAVYDALTVMLRYAAFFRCVKGQNAQNFEAFVQQLSGIAVQPPVKTPTVLVLPEH